MMYLNINIAWLTFKKHGIVLNWLSSTSLKIFLYFTPHPSQPSQSFTLQQDVPGEIDRLKELKNEAMQSVTDLKRSVSELEMTEDEALREVTVLIEWVVSSIELIAKNKMWLLLRKLKQNRVNT